MNLETFIQIAPKIHSSVAQTKLLQLDRDKDGTISASYDNLTKLIRAGIIVYDSATETYKIKLVAAEDKKEVRDYERIDRVGFSYTDKIEPSVRIFEPTSIQQYQSIKKERTQTQNAIYLSIPEIAKNVSNNYLNPGSMARLMSILRELFLIKHLISEKETEFFSKISDEIIKNTEAKLSGIETKYKGESIKYQGIYIGSIVAIVGLSLLAITTLVGSLGLAFDRRRKTAPAAKSPTDGKKKDPDGKEGVLEISADRDKQRDIERQDAESRISKKDDDLRLELEEKTEEKSRATFTKKEADLQLELEQQAPKDLSIKLEKEADLQLELEQQAPKDLSIKLEKEADLQLELEQQAPKDLSIKLEKEARRTEDPSTPFTPPKPDHKYEMREEIWSFITSPMLVLSLASAIEHIATATRDGISIEGARLEGLGKSLEKLTSTSHQISMKQMEATTLENREALDDADKILSLARQMSQTSVRIGDSLIRA